MISIAVEGGSGQFLVTGNDHAVFKFFDLSPHRAEVFSGGVNAVGFFDAQLVRISNRHGAGSEGSGDG